MTPTPKPEEHKPPMRWLFALGIVLIGMPLPWQMSCLWYGVCAVIWAMLEHGGESML